MFDIAIPALIGVLLIAVIGVVFTTLYRRSTRDEAFVRTGLGGKAGLSSTAAPWCCRSSNARPRASI